MPEIIRKEGNDPLKYTLSRRNKKLTNGSNQLSAVCSKSNEDWEPETNKISSVYKKKLDECCHELGYRLVFPIYLFY